MLSRRVFGGKGRGWGWRRQGLALTRPVARRRRAERPIPHPQPCPSPLQGEGFELGPSVREDERGVWRMATPDRPSKKGPPRESLEHLAVCRPEAPEGRAAEAVTTIYAVRPRNSSKRRGVGLRTYPCGRPAAAVARRHPYTLIPGNCRGWYNRSTGSARPCSAKRCP